MTPFFRLLVANFKQFFRDRTALFFTFAFPLLFMIIFGYVFSEENPVYKVGLVDQESSAVGGQIVAALDNVQVFQVEQGSNIDREMQRLRSGDLRALIVIPTSLQESIVAGQTANITVYYDPALTASSQIILSVLREVVNEANRQITRSPVVLGLQPQSIQIRNLRNIDYLVPGIVAMSVLFLGLFGALPMVEWREKGVLKRLRATPVSRAIFVASQVVYRLVLALLQTLIILAVSYFLFHVQVVGSWLALLALIILGTLTFVSIGYLVASRPRTVEGAMPVIQLVQFPMLFLSGIFFPVEIMPAFMKPIVEAIPLTYLGDVLRQVMVHATPLHSISIDVIVLGGWLAVTMALTFRFFRWD